MKKYLAIAIAVIVIIAGIAGGTTAVIVGILGAGTTLGDGNCKGLAGAGQVALGPLAAQQDSNAREIDAAAKELGLTGQATWVALVVAVGESDLINIDHGDAAGPDSRGLFQQRPSQGWGTEAQVMNPRHAALSFLAGPAHDGKAGLVAIPGWDTMTPTQAGHAVQHNADPNHYTAFAGRAASIAARANIDLTRPGKTSLSTPTAPASGQPTAPGWSDPCTKGFTLKDGPCPLDNTDQKATCHQALGFASKEMEGGSHAWHNLCLKFVSTAYGSAFPQETAFLAAVEVEKAGLMRHDRDYVRGAVLWWDGRDVGNPAGHVAIYAGDGMIYSSDAPITDGRIGLVPMSTLDGWGQKFMGWSPPRYTN